MVLIGIQLDLNRCRIVVDLNRRWCRRILGAHGGLHREKTAAVRLIKNEDQAAIPSDRERCASIVVP